MMIITLSDGSEIQWHVGSKVPEIWQPAAILKKSHRTVVEIQVDGDELGYVLHNFKNIPLPFTIKEKATLRWFGNHAKFIFHNLE